VVGLLDSLPPTKRQPNLLFAAVRFLEGPWEDVERFGSFVVDHWGDLVQVMRHRSTQTNEAARAATLLPLLARLDGPLTLIEVGASAGLCLYPDRYAISYDGGPPLATSPVEIAVTTSGAVPIPARLPTIAGRVGIDLNPLNAGDPDDLAWLHACIWPEHQARRDRLAAAAGIVAADPPRLVRGDLVTEIDGVIDAIPDGTTPVLFHSAVLNYLDPHDRSEFVNRLRRHQSVVCGSPTRRPASFPNSAPTSFRRRTWLRLPTSSSDSTARSWLGSPTSTAPGSDGPPDVHRIRTDRRAACSSVIVEMHQCRSASSSRGGRRRSVETFGEPLKATEWGPFQLQVRGWRGRGQVAAAAAQWPATRSTQRSQSCGG
jgi:Uncharacterized protein conserved in bacteria (DUF2332)